MEPPSTEKTGPRAGDVIDGHLEIESVIGEGITSTVVSAVNTRDGSRVAVKIARGSDLESTERFRRAARGMSKLTSPYAVRVISVGQTQHGQPCMSMELLDGRTLATKLLQQGPLPINEAVRYMIQACEAVAEGHAKSLVHRDIDAENLFLVLPEMGTSEPATIRVLDFGLTPVWRLNKGDGKLKPGDAPGTSYALPPELARGADLDDRADIWGAGACLFRLLTNRYPFNARNLAELCTRVLSERPPDVTKIRPDVNFQLSGVVKRCLEREPGDRYPSMAALIDALRDTLDEAPLTPQVPTGTATLAQLREAGAMTMRDTPRVMRAAEGDVISSAAPMSDLLGDEEETSVFGRQHLSGPPRTVRTSPPSFEALANQLEPHQRRPERAEDGPSTQPLGRLSPLAELAKPWPDLEPESAPRSSQEESIVPQLVPVSDQFAPPKVSSKRDVYLKKPSPAMMAMETAPPPPLPVVTLEVAAQETVQGDAPQLVFSGAPRTLAMPPMTETGSFLPEAAPAPVAGVLPTPRRTPPPPAFAPTVPQPAVAAPPAFAPTVPQPAHAFAPTAPQPAVSGPPSPMLFSGPPPPVISNPPPPVFSRPPPPYASGPPPPYASGPPPPAFSGPPPPYASSHPSYASSPSFPLMPPPANSSESSFSGPAPPISDHDFGVRETPAKKKSGILVPLLFVLAAFVVVGIGLKLGKAKLPFLRGPVAAPSASTSTIAASTTPPPSSPGANTAPSIAIATHDSTPPPPRPDTTADAGETDTKIADAKSTSSSSSGGGRVRPPAPQPQPQPRPAPNPSPRPSPRPNPAPSPSPAPAPAKSGNIYDPNFN